MIYTANVRDWLKTLIAAEHFYIGKLDNKPDKSVGVYPLNQSGAPLTGIGQDTTYDTLSVSVLVHWNNSASQTETAVHALFETIRTARNVAISGHKVYYLELLTAAPFSVGTDEKGVYEWVVEIKIYYERKN